VNKGKEEILLVGRTNCRPREEWKRALRTVPPTLNFRSRGARVVTRRLVAHRLICGRLFRTIKEARFSTKPSIKKSAGSGWGKGFTRKGFYSRDRKLCPRVECIFLTAARKTLLGLAGLRIFPRRLRSTPERTSSSARPILNRMELRFSAETEQVE